MDNPDQSGAVSRLIGILRKVTRIVQLIPFAYLLLVALYLLCESLLPVWVAYAFDYLTFASFPVTLVLLGFGRILKLCAWFKTACLLPMATKIENWVDSFVITFTQEEIILINLTLGIVFLIYIYLANRHFFHGRKENIN